jgi:hypothetical protein
VQNVLRRLDEIGKIFVYYPRIKSKLIFSNFVFEQCGAMHDLFV